MVKKEIWNVVLAAGNSTRMKDSHKLLKKIEEETILRYSVKKVIVSKAANTLVVLNHKFLELENEIADLPVSIVWNHVSTLGISSSLALGIRSLPQTCDAAMILLADQPEIEVEVMNEVLSTYLCSKKPMVLTSYQGKIRHPILFDKLFFKELVTLKGDQGAKSIINANKEKALLHVVQEPAPEDIDTFEDYMNLLKRRQNIELYRKTNKTY